MSDKLALEGGTPVREKPPRLGRGLSFFGAEERDAAVEVLESRSLFRYYGPNLLKKVEGFERDLCAMLDVPHAVALSSGTAALRAGLAALGIGCGDEVIVPSFTFIATVNAVVTMGAVPIFAEIDYSLGLCPVDSERKIGDRTAALMPVHLENQGCAMDELTGLARRKGVAVIEDACQAIGSSYRGRALGTIGDLGAFSLQLEKNITSGEGGALVTSNESLLVRAARYSDQGGQFVTSYGVGMSEAHPKRGGSGGRSAPGQRGAELAEPFAGENLRMTELAGAIAGEQLRRLPGIIEACRTNRRKVLDTLGTVDGLELRASHDPDGDGGSSITWFAPTPEIARTFVKALRAERIPAAQMYEGRPVYANPAILAKRTASGKGGPWNCAEHPASVTYEMGMCPETEELVARSFVVGVGVAFTPSDCEDVATAVAKVASHLL